MQIQDLYINPKNIVTLVPFIIDYRGDVGLIINGVTITLFKFDVGNNEQKEVALNKIKEIQKQIITEIQKDGI